MPEQAKIHTISPDGFPCEITLSADRTGELISRISETTDLLIKKGFSPAEQGAAVTGNAASRPVDLGGEETIKPGDDCTIVIERSNSIIRIFNPYMPNEKERQDFLYKFRDILGQTLKAELVKKHQSKYDKAHWTIPISYYQELVEHPYFANYTVFRMD